MEMEIRSSWVFAATWKIHWSFCHNKSQLPAITIVLFDCFIIKEEWHTYRVLKWNATASIFVFLLLFLFLIISMASLTSLIIQNRSYSCRVAQSRWKPQPLEYLPDFITDCHIESHSYQPKTPLSLGKTILSLTFQAIVSFALAFQNSTSSHIFPALHIVGVAMAVAFAACLSGIFLGHSYRNAANIIEKIGCVSAVIGFYLMTSTFLPSNSWLCWLAFSFSLLAFTVAFTRNLTI